MEDVALDKQLKAPFPYYGGKNRYAPEVWSRLGPLDIYSEPFSGSLAMLLANPHDLPQREIACDTNGFICNFYRAIRDDPEATAYWADYPTIHQDLHARHKWLMQWGKEHSAQLSEDPDWFDAKVAGWWVWGISIWIGGEWCLEKIDKRPYIGGRGVSKQRTQVPDQRPYACDGGKGVSKQRTRVPDQRPYACHNGGGMGISRQKITLDSSSPDRLVPWFQELATRLAKVIILNRDWKSGVTPAVLCQSPSKKDTKQRGIFLDPPYRTKGRAKDLYNTDFSRQSDDLAEESYHWAIEKGEEYRIAYACGSDDFPCPDGWTASKDYKYTGARDGKSDVIFFSPACLPVESEGVLI